MDGLNCYTTSAGRIIYSFPALAFPGLVANIYLISDGERLVLVDCGSGMERSNDDLQVGFSALAERYGPHINLEKLDAIIITHGHIDHFGGLPFIRHFSKAPIAVHVLDRRVLSNHEERLVVASRKLQTFLQEAGVANRHLESLMGMYLFAKGIYRSTEVQLVLEEDRPALDLEDMAEIQIYHVPGHCPGQVCLRVDDILLTADHVLSRTTPHQAPESITNNMGLGHYLDSLARIEKLEGINLALGGHEEPMADLDGRIAEIRQAHDQRLDRVLEICERPLSIVDISRELFGKVDSYHVLLALEETGAHVEYLYQRGELQVTNLEAIENDTNPIILYQRS